MAIPPSSPRVLSVTPTEDYKLQLVFVNGERKTFDMSDRMTKLPYSQLSQSDFMAARVEAGTVVWPDEIDISPDSLYLRSN